MLTTMTATQAGKPRPMGGGHRFVAFAFAASEMVVEAEPSGIITYAAGAFRSRLGIDTEATIGRHLSDLMVPSDWAAVQTAIHVLQERGRLLPCIVHLADTSGTAVVLAGLKLMPERADSPFCFTIGLLPAPPATSVQPMTPNRFSQVVNACFDQSNPHQVALLQLSDGTDAVETLSTVLAEVLPEAMTSEMAPGRFGLLTAGDTTDLLRDVEAALRRQGGPHLVSSRQLSLDAAGLTRSQAVLAVRQALTVFAQDGMTAVDEASFGSGLAPYVQKVLSQVTHLRKAIMQHDFRMVYQPIVSIATRQTQHFEALLRPTGSMAAYGTQDFIGLVETANLAEELDIAVATTVCETADRDTASIALNISGQSVQSPAFRERLTALFRGSRAVQEGRLLVELTETAPVDALEEAAETARSLRSLGIRFCLDDFGAGAADIRLLRALPIDVVKLDGSFIAGLLGGRRERALVAGMIEIARAAGAKVVAERIETEAEAEAAQAVGATFGQGWLYGHPGSLPVPQDPTRARTHPSVPPRARPLAEPGGPRRRHVELDEQWG